MKAPAAEEIKIMIKPKSKFSRAIRGITSPTLIILGLRCKHHASMRPHFREPHLTEPAPIHKFAVTFLKLWLMAVFKLQKKPIVFLSLVRFCQWKFRIQREIITGHTLGFAQQLKVCRSEFLS